MNVLPKQKGFQLSKMYNCIKLHSLLSFPSRSVFPRHSVLLPGWHGPAPQGLSASQRCGRLPGLVPLPGPHLLTAADDGGRPLPVGRPEPPPELHPHDCLPGGLKRLGFILYVRVAFSKSITFWNGRCRVFPVTCRLQFEKGEIVSMKWLRF